MKDIPGKETELVRTCSGIKLTEIQVMISILLFSWPQILRIEKKVIWELDGQ